MENIRQRDSTMNALSLSLTTFVFLHNNNIKNKRSKNSLDWILSKNATTTTKKEEEEEESVCILAALYLSVPLSLPVYGMENIKNNWQIAWINRAQKML